MRILACISVLFLLLLISYENGVNSQWIPKWLQRYYCPSEPPMQYDVLGRRSSGYLVPPQSQGSCGSCWAFATTHAFADQININSNSSVAQFSPDHLAKCSPYSRDGNGCCGGNIYGSTLFLRTIGAYPDSCYPYTLKNYSIPKNIQNNDEKRIQFKNANPLVCPSLSTCTNGDSVPTPQRLLGAIAIANSPSAVIAALNNGPLYATVSPGYGIYHLQNYGCGVFTDSDSFPSDLSATHAVEIVDYSSSSYNGTPFYVIKNSWGSSWGEEGYFRIVQTSRLIFDIYALVLGNSMNSVEMSMPITQDTCSPVQIKVTEQQPLINDSVTFALEQLNSMKLLTCIAGSGTPTVEQISIINATEQVVAGMITDISLRVAVTGCEEDIAILRVIVLQNMNSSLTLLDYSYTTSNSAALLLHNHSFGLLLALLGFSFGLLFP